MYACHYRILYPRVISELQINHITKNLMPTLMKCGLWERNSPMKPITWAVRRDHMHVLSDSMDRKDHEEFMARLMSAITMISDDIGCESGEFIIENRTVSNRDIDLHRFIVESQDQFHAFYGYEGREWNCIEEDKYFDAHSIYFRYSRRTS
jgi:hypothetical protein